MWFPSSSESSLVRSSRMLARRGRRATDRRQNSRRLLLEGLEDRRLMAFNVLAEFATGPYPTDLALAQFDADGNLDLVTANSGDNSVSFMSGNGDGTFDAPATPSATVAYPRSLTVGDFNNDGVNDLVTGNSSDLSLLLGNADGSFQPAVTVTIPWQLIPSFPQAGLQPQYPNSVATGDFNGDGNLDLAVPGQTSYWYCPYGCYVFGDNYVNVLLGNGTGAFPSVEVEPHQRGVASVAAADINNDGLTDVLTANYGDLSVFFGDGTGAIGAPQYSGSGNSSGLPSVSLVDFDGDGNLDAVTSNGNALVIQKGQGDGTFIPSPPISLGESIDAAVVGDVNADGKLDLVAVGSPFHCTYGYYYCYEGVTRSVANVVLGTGQGAFSSPISSLLGEVLGTYDSVHFSNMDLADLTGDGLPEIVAVDYYGSRAIIAEGNWPPADAPFLSFSSATVTEGDTGSVAVTLTASLSAAYTQTVTANFHTADGAAVAGSDYESQLGSLTFAPGETSQTITLLVHGDRLSESDEAFSVRLTNVVNATVASTGTVTILDNEPRISIDHRLSSNPLTVVEGDTGTTDAVFTVSLATAYDQEVTVDYLTVTGHTTDIIDAAGTLVFAAGETSKTISVQVVGDLIHEGLEAFNLYLSNPSPNATIVAGDGYCYIEDNDPPPPTLAIDDVTKNEGNSGTTSFTFTVSLTAPSSAPVSVSYATANGTAKSGSKDYVAKSGTLLFAVGETTKTITISVKGDKSKEAHETFFINLLSSEGALIDDGQGVGTIWNDDGGGKKAQRLSASSIDAAIDDLMTDLRKKRRR